MIEVTAHQVASVMAGDSGDNTSITYCTDDYLPDSVPHYQESEIESYLQTIFQAVRFGIIKPIRASYTSAWGDTTNVWTTQIDVDTIDRNTQIHDATFLAADIWPWANQLLSDDSPWYGFSDPKKTRHYQKIGANSLTVIPRCFLSLVYRRRLKVKAAVFINGVTN